MKRQVLPIHVFVGCVSWVGFMILAFAPTFGFKLDTAHSITAIFVCTCGFVFGWVGQVFIPRGIIVAGEK